MQISAAKSRHVTTMTKYISRKIGQDLDEYDPANEYLYKMNWCIYGDWDPLVPVTKEEGNRGYRTVLGECFIPSPGYEGRNHPTIVLPPEVRDRFRERCLRMLREWGYDGEP